MSERVLVKNAADEGQVRTAANKQSFEQARLLHEVKTIMQSKSGRHFIWRYLNKCMVFKPTFSDKDASRTFYNEGIRRVGLWLHDEIKEADHVAYLTMISEARIEESPTGVSTTNGENATLNQESNYE